MSAIISYAPKLTFATENAPRAIRPGTEIRQLFLRGSVVSQATGSATCELGRTKVVCSVHGPRPRRQAGRGEFSDNGSVDVEATFAPFSRRFTSAEARDKAGRELSAILESCLQSCVQVARFPKSVVDVFVTVLEDDGASVACAALCASYALAKSSIDMFDLAVCCSLAVRGSDQNIIVDPDANQEQSALARCNVGILASSGKVVCFDVVSTSSLSPDVLQRLHSTGSSACTQLALLMREQLKHEARVDQI